MEIPPVLLGIICGTLLTLLIRVALLTSKVNELEELAYKTASITVYLCEKLGVEQSLAASPAKDKDIEPLEVLKS